MLISLLTDFGVADTYVGQVKAAILSVAPAATLVDLSHAVPPQDVPAGAFLLWSAVQTFPPGSIHLGVVDPGVGSPRRAIAMQSQRGDCFVGPDNGLLIPAVDRLGGAHTAVELTRREYWRASASSTFHGRDIFALVAGHLAAGVPLERLGPPAQALQRLELPRPHGLEGEVLHVDAYGNLVTNVQAAALPPHYAVHVNGHVARGADYYAAVPPGSLLALVGSAGLLEISVRDGSAAAATGATRGTPVTLEPR